MNNCTYWLWWSSRISVAMASPSLANENAMSITAPSAATAHNEWTIPNIVITPRKQMPASPPLSVADLLRGYCLGATLEPQFQDLARRMLFDQLARRTLGQ